MGTDSPRPRQPGGQDSPAHVARTPGCHRPRASANGLGRTAAGRAPRPAPRRPARPASPRPAPPRRAPAAPTRLRSPGLSPVRAGPARRSPGPSAPGPASRPAPARGRARRVTRPRAGRGRGRRGSARERTAARRPLPATRPSAGTALESPRRTPPSGKCHVTCVPITSLGRDPWVKRVRFLPRICRCPGPGGSPGRRVPGYCLLGCLWRSWVPRSPSPLGLQEEACLVQGIIWARGLRGGWPGVRGLWARACWSQFAFPPKGLL